MKIVRGGVAAVIILAAVGLLFLTRSRPRIIQTAQVAPPAIPAPDVPKTESVLKTNALKRIKLVGKSKYGEDFTEAEKTDLAKKFVEKFKPAVEKWCKAYAGHLPFRPEDFKLDQFHSRTGSHLYTFMVGDITLTLQDPDNMPGKVFYMARGTDIKTMNAMPSPGSTPDITVPVTTDEVINMVKADTGIEYPPGMVQIRPTGAASAFSGGAFVDVNQTMVNGMMLLDGKSISMVFGPDGKLVNYYGTF